MQLRNDNRKIAIIGAGNVGMSTAFAVMNRKICDEMVIIDVNAEKAIGEADDLNHGLSFLGGGLKIYAGSYGDCCDADMVVIAAGVAQREAEPREALLKRNNAVMKSIAAGLTKTGFSGIALIAANPVDVMTYAFWELSGYPANRVIGTGTSLDTARIRFLLGRYFEVDARSVHAYVLGEHGSSEVVAWSQTLIASKPVFSICEGHSKYRAQELLKIGDEVKFAADRIISAKGYTSWGIGMCAARIIEAVLGNENSVLTVSALLDGQYGERGVFAGVPCILNRDGVRDIVELNLSVEESGFFSNSCKFIHENCLNL